MGVAWTVERDELLEAAEVLDMVPARPGIPSSEFFQIEAKKKGLNIQVASDTTADITLKGEGEWPFSRPFYLDRRVFVPFVMAARNIKSSTAFRFSMGGKQLIVRHGNRVARFSSQKEVSGYGFPPKVDIVTKMHLNDKLRSLIHCARECATDDPVAPQLNCVYVLPGKHRISVYATNTNILYRAETKMSVPKGAIVFPLYLVQLLGSDKLKDVKWQEKFVALTFKHGRIWQAVSAKARKSFPVDLIRQYLKLGRKSKILFSMSGRKFARVVNRLCGYLASVRRRDWTLEISGNKGDNFVLLQSTIPQSVFKEKVTLETALSKSVYLYWPLDMLEPVFQFVERQKNTGIAVRLDKKGRSHIKAGAIEIVIPGKK